MAPFAYYGRLTRSQQAVYRQSDALVEIRLEDPTALYPHVREPHRVGEPGDQLLARPFRRGALLGVERGFERRDS